MGILVGNGKIQQPCRRKRPRSCMSGPGFGESFPAGQCLSGVGVGNALLNFTGRHCGCMWEFRARAAFSV